MVNTNCILQLVYELVCMVYEVEEQCTDQLIKEYKYNIIEVVIG